MSQPKYNHIVVAGTFDHLHAGHQYFLDTAFQLGKKVSIGITTDSFIKHKTLSASLEPFSIRLSSLRAYLKKNDYLSRAVIAPIIDMYGTTSTNRTLEAILVTSQTYPNAVKVNKARKKNGLRALSIIKLPLKKGSNNQTISSTRIRAGETDRDGFVYRSIYQASNKLHLPARLREELRIPSGTIYKGSEENISQAARAIKKDIQKNQPVMVVAVGDIIAYSLEKIGYRADLTIIDLKTQRHILKEGITIKVSHTHFNHAGTVSRTSSDAVKRAITRTRADGHKRVLKIQGEEDLLTLAAILHTPLGSLVLYGQHSLGAVGITVTEPQKAHVAKLLKQFGRKPI